MSKAKAMGTAVETAAVRWFQDNGFKSAERIVLHGALDRGDIRLQILPTVIAECKRAQRGVQLTPWMRELAVELTNAGAQLGVLVAKQRGVGDKTVCRWAAGMWYQHFAPLLAIHIGDGGRLRAEEVSPTKINSEYIPSLTCKENRTKACASGWSPVPFALTYTPGHPEQRMVVGPLEQFVALMIQCGYGD